MTLSETFTHEDGEHYDIERYDPDAWCVECLKCGTDLVDKGDSGFLTFCPECGVTVVIV